MRLRFHTNTLLLLTLLAALCVQISMWSYEHWYVPHRAVEWHDFSPPRLAHMRSQGRVVIVNVTSNWLMGGMDQPRQTIDRPAVRNALYRHDGIAMSFNFHDDKTQGAWRNALPAEARVKSQGLVTLVYSPDESRPPIVLGLDFDEGHIIWAIETAAEISAP